MCPKNFTHTKQRYRPNTEYVRFKNGVTPSERYLTAHCDKTFLSLWSYPNLHRKPGKELCDLLVVFENHVIIFSDKYCEFPNSGNLNNDWARWYREAIAKSAQQLWGAEDWIRDHPDRIFLDARCTRKFPLRLNANSRFHRILVAHGASARCKKELGGIGSLMVSTREIGSDCLAGQEAAVCPFMVGQIDPNRGYVHVLDDVTFEILVTTLDTIADFTAYFIKKEEFMGSGRALAAAGEEELLAYYLTHLNDQGEHDFVFSRQFRGVCLEEGFWSRFVESPERQRQLQANEISYIWDDITERFTQNFLGGTSHFLSHPSLTAHESIVRFFAREPRTRRRMLMAAILDMIENTNPTWRRVQVVLPSRPRDPHFVFLVFPKPEKYSYEDYRDVRMHFLQMCCSVAKLKFPDALDIVGLATETSDSLGRSEDAAYLDARLWTEEQASAAREAQKTFRILTKPNRIAWVEREYPS